MLHLLIGKTFAEFDVQIFQMQMIHFQKSFHANLISCIMELQLRLFDSKCFQLQAVDDLFLIGE